MSIEIDVLNGDTSWPLAKPLFDAVWPPDVVARLPWAGIKFANAELRVLVQDETGDAICHVGLYRREVAAYEVSTALGWGVVPETVLREDAPLGPGSLQRFVDADFEQHYFTLLEDRAWHDDLRRMAVVSNLHDLMRLPDVAQAA